MIIMTAMYKAYVGIEDRIENTTSNGFFGGHDQNDTAFKSLHSKL